MTKYLFAFLVLALACSNFYGDVHWGAWFTFYVFGILMLCRSLWKSVHWSVSLFAGWSMLSAAFTFGYWMNMYMGNNPESFITALHMLSAQAYIALFVGSFMMLKLQRHQVRHLLDGFAVVGIIQGIVFLLVLEGSYIWPFGYVKFPELLHMAGGLQGLFGNTSMAACVSALTVPLMLEGGFYRWKWLRLGSLFSALAVIYAAQSTMGFLTLIVGTAGYYLSKLRTLRQSLKLIFASLLAVIALGILFDYQFFDLEKIDRLQAWPKFMRWWLDKLPLLWQWLPAQFIGTGNGTFWFLGPIVQQQVGLPKDQGFWTWLHNDWLQLTFEEGYIGLVLGLNMAMFTLLRAYREHKYDVFGSLCAYGFLGLGMYPANLAFTALFGMTLVRSAFQKSRVR